MALGLGANLTKGGVDPYNMYRSKHCVRFDGTDDFLEIADSATFNHVGSGDSQFTIACWFKLDVLPSVASQSMSLMAKFDAGNNKREWMLYIRSTDDKPILVLSTDGTGDSSGDSDDTMTHSVCNTTAVTDTKWHHIMVSYNGSPSQGINCYFDGVAATVSKDAQLDSDFTAVNQDDAKVYIGAYLAGSMAYHMNGYIADPIYINRFVGSSGPGKYMYNKGKPRNLSRYVGYTDDVSDGVADFKRAYWQMGDNKYDVKHADGTDHAIVDATEGVGPNLITNGTFDGNALGWVEIQSGASLYNAENGGSAKVTIDGSSTYNGLTQNITYSSGKHYRVTFDAKGSATNQIRLMDNGTSGDSALHASSTSFALTTDWKTYSFTWTADANSELINIVRHSGSSWYYFVDNIKIEELKGDVAISKNMSKGIVAESPGIGRDSYSFAFDGTNDYVHIPDNSSLDFGTSDFSISGWVKTTDASAKILNKWVAGTGGYFVYVSSDGKFRARIDDGGLTDNTDYVVNSATTAINDGQWHHFAVVFDRSTDMRIYTDGVLETTDTNIPSVGNIDTSLDCFIGCNDTQGEDFAGNISDIAIFNKALSAAEVRENMGPGLDLNNLSTEANIVAWWRFGDGTLDYKRDTYSTTGCLGDENNATVGSDVLGGKGDFSDPSYWTIISGESIVEGGKGKWLGNGSYGHIRKAGVLTANQIYELIIDIESNDGGDDDTGRVNLNFDPESFPMLHASNTIGTGLKTYFKAQDTDFILYQSNSDGSYSSKITIDNVVVRPVNGIPGIMRNMHPADIELDAP